MRGSGVYGAAVHVETALELLGGQDPREREGSGDRATTKRIEA